MIEIGHGYAYCEESHRYFKDGEPYMFGASLPNPNDIKMRFPDKPSFDTVLLWSDWKNRKRDIKRKESLKWQQ